MVGNESPKPTLLYLADPMCSWCWGFSPVIEQVADDYAEQLDFRVVAGGLFPDTTEVMNPHFKAQVKDHWEHVEERTGQPFDFELFQREDFVYNTEPACRALVAARALDPSRTLAMLRELHRAFYAENRDITDADVATNVAVKAGLDAGEFRAMLDSAPMRERVRTDFNLAREIGMRGFPTLLGYDHQHLVLITEGYAAQNPVRAKLDRWLSEIETPAEA